MKNKIDYLNARPQQTFLERSRDHEEFLAELRERLKAHGYKIFSEAYHDIWQRSDYSQLWVRFDPTSWFLRYKPDLIALGAHSLWLEVKTSGRSDRVYFPFTNLVYTAVVAEWFGLPVAWAYRDREGWERGWWASDNWELLSPDLELFVGTHLDPEDWGQELQWTLSLLLKKGIKISPRVRKISVSGSGRPFLAFAKDRIRALTDLNVFLEAHHAGNLSR